MKRHNAIILNNIVNSLSFKTKIVTLDALATTTIELDILSGVQKIESNYVIVGDGITQYGQFTIVKDSSGNGYELFENLATKIDALNEIDTQGVTINSLCAISNSKVSIQVQNTLATEASINLSYLII